MVDPKIKKTLEKALLEAGSILKTAIDQPKKISFKSPISLVTETDKKAEAVVIEIIKTAFPTHSILAEESNPQGKTPNKWIIDPIDGTTNFAHGLPIACVSIAYEENGIIQVGGVWNPFLGEWFWAERGKGASLNGKKISVTKAKSLKESLVATGFPYDRIKFGKYYIHIMENVLYRTQDVRRLGSAAIDLCYVACGRFDGYWEFRLNPWDQAAGVLIVEEAGGKVTNFHGKPVDIYEGETLATNGKIHKELLEVICESALTII
ncbi:MAG: hypothetical protein A3G33_09820 [Omnitrophica bacterium RIFCSPLOWO2_12_FULL_44_17]|uniref:Inositol-1-monophosphatase n=1 Tax=Candidatus Danuiimicrobium aquiferis TaxID=1801832 RepID=A0A1G1KX65_9BACT|nr:MAG: hypothetical protein A3B72_09545 [Omnitrophica bacterium RIFCSPHIGHO2_02_FULL_45_28]OGW89320.1 MAG: hypothetical protein A3E74_08555 [Omnitrophica bacterium RIFCSPHIGHO2_12_FULL_44_12]OGW97477.1 MAG: hypothetical protein A3G33_09820 [Omnitrophica bacterium RIFCSPLOWO2_12_FULL_44_17]OGX04934.1 MAG: hypothetical protein A3J12_06595 [Omnitrophica bacterium RIFCSPLOWO2_02_FULL_44_11]